MTEQSHDTRPRRPLREVVSDIDRDILRLLLRRHNLLARMHNSKGFLEPAEEKALRESWEAAVSRVSRDARLSGRFFSLMQEVEFLPRPSAQREEGEGGEDGQAAGAEAARKAAEALGIECIVLNAEALAGQDADVLGDGGTPLFAALLTAADKLGMQYVATAHRARVETGADGVHTVCPPAGTGSDDSTILAALPQETLARLILPLGDFAPEDVAEMAEDFKV